ncbi:molybdenum cofactor guanylyltransferase [Sphingomonas sp. KR1UV-12]|uniref:Molybdenum cofactor guanylyltransferase n=1 Tax=Sphingomonas aurea TaxID=3063994 RepID=A0ABT9EG99_9SPHN|nr:molybdenum cofactor guanylyltransferase [Sphingomonas sp. KR1UV-12]MDP1025994.1 molybdenum cofactor guanylyltransferase [Sphingomonas sp. KR1UV-12]
MSGLLGAVLAGGQSRRFGSDKAAALLDGDTLLAHARRALAPHVDEVVVVGGIDGLPDLPRPGLGPLGGIAAALDHAATHGFRCVLTIGCDMPVLPEPLVKALMQREPSFCAEAPILGLWPAALGAHLLSYLEVAPERSVRGWARSVGALPILSPVPIPNVNTPTDLTALAEAMLVTS